MSGTISVFNKSHANSVQNVVSSGSVPGYLILSSSSIIYFGNQAQDSFKYTPIPDINIIQSIENLTAFIVGLSVGGFIIFAIICIVVCKIKNKKYHNVNIAHNAMVQNELVKAIDKLEQGSHSDLQ